jgi:hypothetical protein
MSRMKDFLTQSQDNPPGLSELESAMEYLAVSTANLRTYAVGIGLKGARSIQGGKDVLVARLLAHRATLAEDDPRLKAWAHLLVNKTSTAVPPVKAKVKAIPTPDFSQVNLDALRIYATRVGIKNVPEISGGKDALIEALLAKRAESTDPWPSLDGGATSLDGGASSTVFKVDMSTQDDVLRTLIKGIGSLPKSILAAEFTYMLEWDNVPEGWTKMDLFRYNLRFYPHRRARLGAYKDLPAEIRDCLRNDAHPMVRRTCP